jgi:Flp pilus assembly protein TadG
VFARRERAQGLVEFAVVLPLFLVLLLATIDFGWALRAYVTATNSAREGARSGAVGATEANIKAKAVSTSSGLLSTTDVSVTGAQGASGSAVTVNVSYDYDYITPLGGILNFISAGALPDPLPITTSTTMRIE